LRVTSIAGSYLSLFGSFPIAYVAHISETSCRARMKASKALKRAAFSTSLVIVSVSLLKQESNAIQRLASVTVDLSGDVANNMRDVADPLKDTDTAVYWHVPKASGSSIKGYYSCMGLVEGTDMSETEGHDQDQSVAVWTHQPSKHRYINVDTTREEGILRGKQLGLAESGLADIVSTMFPRIIPQMFNEQHQGRYFALLRHPVERAVSLFYYYQIASWERPGVYQPELEGMDIDEWLEGRESTGGYMVSLLVNKDRRETLTDDDLEMAKEILRTKFIVGLVTEMEESVNRFDQYFGWSDNELRSECQDRFIVKGVNKNSHNGVKPGSDTWNKLTELNRYDLQLYQYAVQLFEEQAEFFSEKTMDDSVDTSVSTE